ncbi:MAG: aminopeptidase P family protein [Proteobacteria bacterium]|nr:aminopeptidase P family protein [Pseudomonadota bacterium]
MLESVFLSLALASGFVHPTPTPPADLPVNIYKERRERVMKALNGCVALVAAQGAASGITEDFRQDGDFFWLTGVNEPDAFLLLAPKAPTRKVMLYLKRRDPEAERWTGPREAISPELIEKYGVDRVLRGSPEDSSAMTLAGESHDCVSIIAPVTLASEDRADAQLSKRLAERYGLKIVYQRNLLAEMREAHSPEEIERMRRAISITRTGHEAAARFTVRGLSERDVQTQMEYAFFTNGATGLSYPTIVGAGPDGAVLHWDKNTHLLKDGEIVVIDAAAEYGRYAADITRTYPVSGHFNSEQAAVYRAVYQAQEDVFAAIKPGVSMADLQRVAEDSLRRAHYLGDFIHGIGHFVGLDVHDTGLYEKPLPVGAIVTVEPGVYLPEKKFGVRIEDEVLITTTGYQLLSDQFPRKLEDVEAWVAKARK